ncbi:glycoside hydrolase [Campylobacterota bacterium]|nr:glycoside hydrolase [Campylobacterota bacterium]
MPWVFLHAIKDYGEMIWIQSHYPNIRATYNLVPSLMTQLEFYIKDYSSDRFLALLAKDSESLSEDERLVLLDQGFFANPRTMIAPFWRFSELHSKRTLYKNAQEASRNFSDEELTDISVLFLLSWCGNLLRRTNGIVGNLIAKASGYTQEEKIGLIETLIDFCKTILPMYRTFQEQGKVSVFTTPFFHPILPLLLDLNAAKASDSNLAIPSKWSDFSDDATRHVEDAINWYQSVFGISPPGFWPAEGAVSSAALSLMAKHGIQYTCTDEDIFFKSVPNPHYRIDLYKRYALNTENGEIGLLFRDKALSDLIGFNYSNMDPQVAADDFVSKLRGIYDAVDFNAIVPVFLDGENAWEFYDNNAFGFFNALYERLSNIDWCKTVTIPEAHRLESVPKVTLNSIGTGSWIFGTLGTWMGHSEKNRAWELLAQTHELAKAHYDRLDAETQYRVTRELMIAEGSDWFWWYGDDHYTPQAAEFDEIFRGHLKQVYQLLEEKPHSALSDPIKRIRVDTEHIPQSAPISPNIDGHRSYYFEWTGAGKVDLSRAFSTMDTSGTIIKTLLYGTDGEYFYFQLSGGTEQFHDGGYELAIDIKGVHTIAHRLRLSNALAKEPYNSTKLKVALGECLEIAVAAPLTKPTDQIEVSFLLYKSDTLIQRVPVYNSLTLKTPNFDTLWYI